MRGGWVGLTYNIRLYSDCCHLTGEILVACKFVVLRSTGVELRTFINLIQRVQSTLYFEKKVRTFFIMFKFKSFLRGRYRKYDNRIQHKNRIDPPEASV